MSDELIPAAVTDAIAHLGGPTAVANRRGLTPWAVSKWTRHGVPSDHVLWLAEETEWRYTPHQLAPRLYPHPDDGLPSSLRMREPSARDSPDPPVRPRQPEPAGPSQRKAA